MLAKTLRDALERHRRVLRGVHVHVLADAEATVVSSALISGHVMRTVLEGMDATVNCTVVSEVLVSMVAQTGDVRLMDDGSMLHVACGRSRGQVPTVAEEAPSMPHEGGGADARVSGADALWLRNMLPRVSLSKTERDGCTSIEGVDGELRACTYDEVHGAFAYRASRCSVSIGLLPSDAALFLNAIQGEGDLTVRASDDNRIIVRTGSDALVLPCIEARSQPRDVVIGNAKAHWRVQQEQLQEAVQAVAVVAKAKDAGPVTVQCGQRGGLLIGARSPSGKLSRELPAKVVHQHAPVGLSIALLQDITSRIPKDATVTAYLEPGDEPSPRILYKTDGDVTYVMLTSSD